FEVGRGVMGYLIPMAVDSLGEIALTVQYPYRDKGNPQVTGRLAVIAGQDAEPTRIDGQAFMEAEFGAEIRDQIMFWVQYPLDSRADLLLMIGVVGGQDPVVILHEDAVFRRLFQALLRNAAQEHLGIVPAGLPQVGVQPIKQPTYLTIPAVKQVVGKF